MEKLAADDHTCPILTSPSAGTPEVLTDSQDIGEAGRCLAAGTGPLAVDTERASAFRYDDRAFLIQFRRSHAGTFLVDPETNPDATRALAPLVNPLAWIIHSAPSDLPCLAALGLYPSRLFDTEVAGRLVGLDRVNLASMTEKILGIGLAKGHGKEDWSTRPLPKSWLDYAALDVELLIELSSSLGVALAELDREKWFNQECEYIRKSFARAQDDSASHAQRWRSMKGVGKLKTPAQLVVANYLWHERDRIAQLKDITPTKVLTHSALLAIAEQLPQSAQEIAAIKGFPRRSRGATHRWLKIVDQALGSPEETWPRVSRSPRGRLHHRNWPERAPEVAELFEEMTQAVDDYCDGAGIRRDTIVTATELRDLAWWAAKEFPLRNQTSAVRTRDCLPDCGQLEQFLLRQHKRPWQAELIATVLGQQVFLARRFRTQL